jgi:hypothetical protein
MLSLKNPKCWDIRSYSLSRFVNYENFLNIKTFHSFLGNKRGALYLKKKKYKKKLKKVKKKS